MRTKPFSLLYIIKYTINCGNNKSECGPFQLFQNANLIADLFEITISNVFVVVFVCLFGVTSAGTHRWLAVVAGLPTIACRRHKFYRKRTNYKPVCILCYHQTGGGGEVGGNGKAVDVERGSGSNILCVCVCVCINPVHIQQHQLPANETTGPVMLRIFSSLLTNTSTIVTAVCVCGVIYPTGSAEKWLRRTQHTTTKKSCILLSAILYSVAY